MLREMFRPGGEDDPEATPMAEPAWQIPDLNLDKPAFRPCPPLIGADDENRLSGSLGLLRAVFVDGIRTYCRAVALEATWTPEYREALRWMIDETGTGLFSFENLCQIFALDARELRRSLRRFPEDPDPRLLRLAGLESPVC